MEPAVIYIPTSSTKKRIGGFDICCSKFQLRVCLLFQHFVLETQVRVAFSSGILMFQANSSPIVAARLGEYHTAQG